MSDPIPAPVAPETQPKAPRTHSAWMGFATREITGRGSVRIRLRWGRLGALLLVLGLVFWAGKSWAFYYFFKNMRGFEAVSFSDMIYFPFNRGNVRVQQGNYQIDQAKAALQREDYRRAYSLLREGVARSAGNLEGRMLLSQMYAGWRPDLASDLMLGGADLGGMENAEYVKILFMLLLSQKKDAEILELTGRLLAQEHPAEIQQLLYVARLQAAMYNGRFDIARQLFEETDLRQTLDGIILGTQLYMRTGDPETATQVLMSVINSFPDAQIDPIYTQLVSVYKARKLYDRAREVALELIIRNPMQWRPRVLMIDILSESERIDRRDREIEALLQQHRNDEQAMTALAQLAANYGNVRAASRLYEIALENGYSLSLFSLTLAEALLKSGDSQRAIDLCNELVREDPAWLVNAESSFNAIRSLAYFNNGDPELGRLYMRNFLSSQRTNVNQLYQAARSFHRHGLNQEALQILEDAHRRDPRNESVLSFLIEVEMEAGAYFAITEHLRQLFTMRRPEYTTLGKIHQQLHSDRFLFTEDRVGLLEDLEKILAEPKSMDWEIWQRGPNPARES